MHLNHGGNPCPVEHLPEMEDDLEVVTEDVADDSDLLLQAWEPLDDDIIVMVDLSGVHQCQVRWCHCPSAPEKRVQLFRDGLFSSSFKRPRTAFSFALLEYFHIDSVECKTSALNFFSKLRRITNYTVPDSVPVTLQY